MAQMAWKIVGNVALLYATWIIGNEMRKKIYIYISPQQPKAKFIGFCGLPAICHLLEQSQIAKYKKQRSGRYGNIDGTSPLSIGMGRQSVRIKIDSVVCWINYC